MRLPAALWPLFWDHDLAGLRWDSDRELILGRVLAEGGLAQARLVRRRLGDDAIRDWLRRHRARGLSPSRIRFWALLLEVEPLEADPWVRAARRSLWHRRAHP
jgi:hypothetical protein